MSDHKMTRDKQIADAAHWEWMINESDADPGDVNGWDDDGFPIFGYLDGVPIIGFENDGEPVLSKNYTIEDVE